METEIHNDSAAAPVAGATRRPHTGYRVWVGGESYWFCSLDRARGFAARRRNQYGPALVQVDDVATGKRI